MEKDNSAFDLKSVYEHFSSRKKEDDSVSLDNYIDGYEELSKFFNLFGSVFHFVNKDVMDKLKILRNHRQSAAGPNFISVQSMIDYEVANNLTTNCVKTKKPCSGSRTLLRLHRALEFILHLMKRIPDLKSDEGMSTIAWESYDTTLSKHHPWLIRKGVGIAVYTLPTRKQLLHRMHANSEEELIKLLNQVVASAEPLYDSIQDIYERNNLLDLP